MSPFFDEIEVAKQNATNDYVQGKINAATAPLTTQLAAANAAKLTAEQALATVQSNLTTTIAELSAARSSLTAAEAEIDTLENQLVTQGQALTAAQSSLSTANAQIATLNSQITTKNAQIATQTTQINNLNGQIVVLNARIAELEAGQGPVGTPSEGLAFEKLPSGYGDKMVLAHYFAPFPISVDNGDVEAATGDYWQRNWNLAEPAEGGVHTNYAGYSRDRPMPRGPRSQSNWKYEDSKEDVRQALAGSLDGFWNNIMGIGGTNEERYKNVALAASELVPDGSFKVAPMIDTNGSIGNASAQQISDTIAWYAFTNAVRGTTTGRTRRPSAWFLPDNRFVVGSYKADGKDAAWWQAIFNDLQSAYGITVAFVAVFSNYNNAASLNSVTWARSVWGDGADPNIAENYGNHAASARSAGKLWMAPVWAQDMRPQGGLFDESKGTGALRAYFERAIADDADLIQIPTWSDYREHGQINLSVKRGMSLLDLTAYYIYKLKTGNEPPILRDGFYLSHRNQLTGLPRTAFKAYDVHNAYQTGAANSGTGKAANGMMGHWVRPNRSALVNEVEVVSMLTAPATGTINVGGTVHTYSAPAGLFVKTVPLANGTISVEFKRGTTTVAQLTSPALVRANPYNQDMGYHTFSSFAGHRPEDLVPSGKLSWLDFQGRLIAKS